MQYFWIVDLSCFWNTGLFTYQITLIKKTVWKIHIWMSNIRIPNVKLFFWLIVQNMFCFFEGHNSIVVDNWRNSHNSKWPKNFNTGPFRYSDLHFSAYYWYVSTAQNFNWAAVPAAFDTIWRSTCQNEKTKTNCFIWNNKYSKDPKTGHMIMQLGCLDNFI